MEEPSKRKTKCHPITWVILFVSVTASFATAYLPSVSSEWFEMPPSTKSMLLVEVPDSSGHLFFLEEEPFQAVMGRTVEVSDPTDSIASIEEDPTQCKSKREIHPTCNEFHATNFIEMFPQEQLSILSDKGSWRTAWQYNETVSNSTAATERTMVLKTLRPELNYTEENFDFQKVDALAMERLTSSPYIIDMYSYCGMSVLTDFGEKAVSRVLDKTIKPIDRLKLARQVARGVADMHHVGVIHNDVNQANLAYSTRKGVPVFFDFNIAVFRDDKSCPFVAKFPNVQWRSPEELILGNRLTEKVDIFALGNILFRFIDGEPPWGRHRKSVEQEQFILDRKQHGKLPPYTRPVKNDTATAAMVHIMEKCYTFKTRNRPSASRVVSMFNDAVHDASSASEKSNRQRKHRLLAKI